MLLRLFETVQWFGTRLVRSLVTMMDLTKARIVAMVSILRWSGVGIAGRAIGFY